MSKFTGVWAIFEYLDETTETIEQVREKGFQPTVLMPCPRHEIDHALDAKKYGKKKYKEKYEQEMNYAVQNGGDAHDDNYFEKKAERYGQKMARKFLKKN